MRRLNFGKEKVDRERFTILYGGICVSERGLTRTELNTFNQLAEKFESIASPIEGAKDADPIKFRLGDEGGEILLEDTEYTLMNQLLDGVRWLQSSARAAGETFKWLETIPQEVLKVVK